ncbi:MAG: hypothetical protein AAF985_05210, partial [Bacteroidota bacterium]
GGAFILDLRDYQGVGTYDQNIFFKTENYGPLPDYPSLVTANPDLSVQITLDDGTFIEGNLTGTATDLNGIQQNIGGSFKIRKAP